MQKIFIDCGAHCGCSNRKIRAEFPDFRVFSFEPNPFFNTYCSLLINKAVWTYDGEIDFNIMGGISAGSSILEEKVRYTAGANFKRTKVECFDLAKFIKSLSPQGGDLIYLKMDIEGAEYTVLPHLIETETFNHVDKLFIEWHYSRCGVSKEQHDDLVSQIKIPIHEWSGMRKDFCIKHTGLNYRFES